MRSALLAVDGVTRVQVAFESGEIFVTYDARRATVEGLIAAVDEAPGPVGPNPYRAIVKAPPRPAPSGS